MININLIKLTTDIILELDNMSRITLPKNALEKIKIGQAFAEYDIIRDDL
jgi:hypothetical protein